jgi:putative endonuclease
LAQHNLLGKQGESAACDYLIKQGYLILERGWRSGHLELDIIATINDLLVVVEVKTRSKQFYADPDDTVSNKKLRQIYEATDRYMEKKSITWEVRYDLITVIQEEDRFIIEHIEDAFYPFMNL